MDETKDEQRGTIGAAARLAVAMASKDGIILDITTEEGEFYSFKLKHPSVTLDSLQNALAEVRSTQTPL